MSRLKRTLKWTGWVLLGGLIALGVLIAIPIHPTVTPLGPRASTRYWTMPAGYRIAYTIVPAQGVPTGAPVIYLHGGPGGYVHSSTIATLGRLAELGRDVYLYEQSGSGLSDRRAPSATSFDSHVRDLEQIVRRQIGVERVVVLGHSYGGELAAVFAADHPELIESLVLSSPGALEPTHFDEKGRWVNESRYPVPAELEFVDVAATMAHDSELRRLPLRAIASIALATMFDVKLASDRELDAALNTLIEGMMHNMVCDPANVRPEEGGGGAYSRTSANFYPDDFEDRRPRMRAMRAPVLVLQGQCDYIPYAAVYEYADLFPNARYQFLQHAGHIMWWDRPDEYVAAIAAFLGEERSPIAGGAEAGSKRRS